VQGEFFRAHRNRLIGTLRVRGLEADLPAGSRIEVLLQLDRSGQLQARAEVPALGQTFEDVVHVLVPSPSFETLEKEAAAAEQRLADAQRSGFKAGHPETLRRLSGAVGLMAEVRSGLSAARGGDADAAQRVTRLLLELGAEIDAAEGELEWPELEAEADDVIQTYGYWVAQRGTASEQQLFEESLAAALAARKARAGPELDRQVKVMRKLGTTAYARDPLAVREDFEWLAANVAEATDVRKASELVTRGRAALEKDDLQALRTINQQLWALHPGTPEERRRSFGSGIVS
jgi:molecular chaperone DnaK